MRNKYRQIKVNGKRKMEHRHVMEQSLGRSLLKTEDVHHIDGDGRNNVLSNLQLLTHKHHARITNRTRKRNKTKRATSKYHGVYFHTKDNKWAAYYKQNGNKIWLGQYATEIEAAKARDKFAINLGLPLNFSEGRE